MSAAPMPITPITSQALVLQAVTCDKIYLDLLQIDARDRAASPKVVAYVTPYAVLADGSKAYAQQVTLTAQDLYAAAQAVPEIGAAIAAVQAGLVAWWQSAQPLE